MKELKYYYDYLKNALLEQGIKFEIIEDIIPPILNKQRWFMIDKYKQLPKIRKKFVRAIENLFNFVRTHYNLPLFPVFEYGIIETHRAIYRILDSVYLLDFNLPVEETKKFRNPHTPPDVLTDKRLRYKLLAVYRGRYAPGELILHHVPITIWTGYMTELSDIEKTIRDGHYLVFKIANKDNPQLASYPSKLAFTLTPGAYYFYYIDGKVKHITEDEYKIDNIFLQKCEKVLSLMFSSLKKAFGILNGKVEYEYTKMKMEIKTKTSTIQLIFFFNIMNEISYVKVKLDKKPLDNRLEFINRIESLIEYMWFKVFGEEITFSDDLDVKLKEMEDRMLFMKEALDFVR
ncbi:MAG: hypothetical protein ABIM98_07450 [candidate division WOR-3 bacterium]